MPQAKAFFGAGVKVVGILTIIWAFTHIVNVAYAFYSLYNQPDMMPENVVSSFRFSMIFQIAAPIVLFAIGYYLLKSETVLKFAYSDSEQEKGSDVGKYFILLMKLAGLVLIIYGIPQLFQLASNAIFIKMVQGMEFQQQVQAVTESLVSTVIELLLGFYLLASGRFFYWIGFSELREDGS